MIEALVSWSVARRGWVLGVWGLLSLLAAGVAVRLKLDALPDITNNQVQVLTRAPGLTPEEVELRVTRPLEAAIGGLPGLEQHRSISRYGLSAITVVFADDVDPFRARQVVAERLAGAAGGLPAGVEPPEMGPMTGGLGEIFHFTVASPERTPAELLELVTLRAVPLLKQVPDVVEVNTWGGGRRTMEVRADPVRMAARRVTLRELERSLEDGTGAVPGAALEAGARQVLLRGAFRPQSHGELAGALVRHDERGSVRVEDVATLHDGQLPRLGAATGDGRGELVYVMAQMRTGANARETTARVRARMAEVRSAMPADVQIQVVYDRGTLVDATIWTVGRSLLEGGVLVVLVLFLTLGSLRAGLLVAIAIPVSMLGATAAMVVAGVSGNLMSLGAIDFGLLVDGAVVLIEHVFGAEKDPTASWAERVQRACVAVARPTFFGVLVILLVYLPILTLAGVDGKLFRPMAMTVTLALTLALFFSLTFVPAAAAALLGERHVPARHPALVRLLEGAQRRALALLAPRWPLAALTVVAALIAGGTLAARSGSELVPQLDEGDLVIQTTRSPDIALEGAVEEAGRMERGLRAIPEVLRVVSRTGSPAVATDIMGLEQADVFVGLQPRDRWRRGLTREALLRQIEGRIQETSPGTEASFTQPIQMRFNELLGGSPMDVVVGVYGQDLAQLQRTAERMLAAIEREPGVRDARLLTPPSVPLLDVKPDPLRAAQAGFSVGDVLAAVQALRLGRTVGATYDGALEIPLLLRLGERPPSAWELGAAALPRAGGELIPLARVAKLEATGTPTSLFHENGQRKVMVGFNVRDRDLASTVEAAQRLVRAQVPLPEGFRLGWGGQYETFQQAQARLRVVIPLVLALIVLVLFWHFRSAGPLLLVLSHLPFACVGGIAALAWRGLPISLSAVVGFIALSGIAVMNGVVLLTELLSREAAGASPAEAAGQASRSRTRPVSMTALVAALGFLPMALAEGVGAEVQRPLATVVVGGLVTSTTLTLLLLPALYPPLRSLLALVRRTPS
jgi:cobalt-zinc-cadmium resistance protein CzcA